MERSLSDIQQMNDSEVWALIAELAQQLALSGGSRLSPVFLASSLAVIIVIWLTRRPGVGFLAWLFPRRIYCGSSFWVDVKLWLTDILFRLLGLSTVLGLAPLLTDVIQTTIAGGADHQTTWPPILVAAILLAASDFSTYWVHRISHEWPRFWPFHAVHHSAEELNPITVYRSHPVYGVVSTLVRATLIGLTQGILLGLLVGTVDFATILGVNVFYYLFNLAGSNLRHMHIWLSFGPVLERIIISPAQHQIHHSIEPRHFNRNYGEVLAIWDWMFGTLYIPKEREELRFGLGDMNGQRIEQPHPTWRAAMIEPFQSAFNKGRRKRRAKAGRRD